MMQPEKEPKSYSTVQSHFSIRDRHYEARLVDCGKPNCTKCGGRGRRHPSHGPYWYLCYTHQARWYRQYLGKEVDTSRFVTAHGNLDIIALRAKRRNRRIQPAEKSHEIPGQLEMEPPGAPGDIPAAGAAPPPDPDAGAGVSVPRQPAALVPLAAEVHAADCNLILPAPPADPQDPGPLPRKVG